MRNLPDTAKVMKNGRLEIGGCDTIELAQEFGTPLYVLDEETIRGRCRQYLSSFRKYYPNTDVIYACKALCTAAVQRIVNAEGLGLDVSSGGELYTALKAGCDVKKIYFHGNNKSKAEIKLALEAGIGRIVVDNLQELDNVEEVAEKIGTRANILFRVNPGIEAHTHEYIKTGTVDSKFGLPQDRIEEAVRRAGVKKRVNLVGFHAHIGSQIFDIKPFVEEVRLLLDLTLKYKTEELNMGGGLGVAYLSSDEPASIDPFAKEIASVLRDKTMAKLVLEPGRSIVGNAGITLYAVGGVKDIPGMRKYVFVDGGMADNPRPILYQARYEAKIANRAEEATAEKVTIAGRFCESGDVLIKDINLPKVETGDILAVLATGAYNYSMASNYNRVGRPAMVLVNKGSATLILKRETLDDLISNDVIL
jgi:diaminopimelate decarboxylase